MDPRVLNTLGYQLSPDSDIYISGFSCLIVCVPKMIFSLTFLANKEICLSPELFLHSFAWMPRHMQSDPQTHLSFT